MYANETMDTNGASQCGTKESPTLACGSCDTPTTESECKYFCVRCDVFICEICQYHRNLNDDYDDDDDNDGAHFTEVTVGKLYYKKKDNKNKQTKKKNKR